MNTRFKIFNLLGFPIYVDLSWFLVVLLITWSLATNLFPTAYEGLSVTTYWLMGLAGALGLFASILAHELGHAVVAQRNDVPIRGITLFIFGGVAEMSEEPPSAAAEFFVAIAGPIVSVLLAAVFYASGAWAEPWLPSPVAGVLWYLGVINAVVVAFNMIPAFPLDGGRVLRSIIWQMTHNLRLSTRITSTLGTAFAGLLLVLGVFSFIGGNFIGGVWLFFIGVFLYSAAQSSYQQVLIRQALEGEPVARFMRQDVVTAPADGTIRDLVENYIYQHHHKMFPVVRNGELVGCVTTRDVQRIRRDDWSQQTIGEVARECDVQNTISRDADAMQALSLMNRTGASRLMVVEEGRLAGVLSLKDLLRFMSLKMELEEDGAQRS